MKKLKTPGIILLIFLGIYAVRFIFCNFIMNEPPLPEIKHGEFPFTLKYSVDGEEKTVSDVLVCDFDGLDSRFPKYNYSTIKWDSYLKSGKAKINLYEDDDIVIFFYPFEGGDDPCSGEYFMNMDNADRENIPVYQFPEAFYISKDDEEKWKYYPIFLRLSEEELWEKYKIKINEYIKPAPIKNTYRKQIHW